MIGIPKTGTLEHGFISANVTSGYQFTTIDGRLDVSSTTKAMS